MKQRKPTISFQEEEEEEDDAAFEEEEARLREERLKQELDEQNKFDCLCDGVKNCLSLVNSAFGELLDLKDELLEHDLPPSLQVAIILVTGKMFRSITDMHTPVQELIRLVNVYSVPWEQRSESLKKLHDDYESKQRQLNIAIRRLQMIDAHSRRIDKEKRIMNWEKAFAKITSAKSHGRRWKFMIETFKKKVKDGISLSEMEIDLSDDESDEEEDDCKSVNDDEATEKQKFMLSVIAASPPAEDEGSPQAGSDIGSEGDGIPSEISDSIGHAEETSPDVKQRRRGVSFVAADEDDDVHGGKEVVEKIKLVKEEKPPCEDKGVWTGEPEYDTQLALRIFRPTHLKDDDGFEISCNVMFGESTQKTAALPAATVSSPVAEQVNFNEDSDGATLKLTKKGKGGRRKSIGFASKPSSPPAASSPGKSMLKSKPGGILKKAKFAEDEPATPEPEKTNRDKYEEVIFKVEDEVKDPVQITIHQGQEEKMIAMSTLTWEDIQQQSFAIKYEEAEMSPEKEEAATKDLEEQLSNQEMTSLPMQGIKLGIGGHSPGVLGDLSILCYWIKKKKERCEDTGVNTSDIKDLIEEITGVNIDHVSKEELVYMLGREYNDMSTSAMSVVSSSSQKSGYISLSELEVIREQHDLELKNIQDEYEVKVQQLLMEMEKMQTLQIQQAVAAAQNMDVARMQANYIASQDHAPPAAYDFPASGEERHFGGSRWKPAKIPQLPDWGAHLPKDVWVRMRVLTEEMMAKKKQLDMRIRNHIAINIEKKLASQYKLQRNETGINGPLQDVSLPALFMPSRSGNVYNPRARLYFHPTGTSGDLRLTQPPSIFQLPPLPEKAKMSVVNLFELSKNFQQPVTSDWLNRLASAPSRGSRATTAASRVTPHTPAPTANIQSSDVYS